MKVTIEMDNLQKVVEEATERIIKDSLEEAIKEVISNYIATNHKQMIEYKVAEALKTSIDNYIDNSQICIGSNVFGEEPVVMTPKQYINNQIQVAFKEQKIKEEEKTPYGRAKTYELSFKDYLDKKFNIDFIIKDYMDSFGRNFKHTLNTYLQKNFNENLRKVLCDTVIDALEQEDKFKSVVRSIENLQ